MTFTLVVWSTRYYRLIMSQLYFLGSLINYYVKERNRPGESNVSIQTKLWYNLKLCSPRLISTFCCFLEHLLLSDEVKYKNMIKAQRNYAEIQIILSLKIKANILWVVFNYLICVYRSLNRQMCKLWHCILISSSFI